MGLPRRGNKQKPKKKKKKKKGAVLGTLFMIALSKDNPRY